MSIASMQAQLSKNKARIKQLEREIYEIRERIKKLSEEEEVIWKLEIDNNRFIEREALKVTSIKAVENMKIAQVCADGLNTVITGPKSVSSVDAYVKTKDAYVKEIDYLENEIEIKQREIRRLEEECSYLTGAIHKEQEAQRREQQRREQQRREA